MFTLFTTSFQPVRKHENATKLTGNDRLTDMKKAKKWGMQYFSMWRKKYNFALSNH